MTDDDEIRNLRERMHGLSNIAQNLVTRDATMALQLSHLVSLVAEHKADSQAFMRDVRENLSHIRVQTTETNGRVNAHDMAIGELKDSANKAMWWALGINGSVIAGVIIFLLTQ